MDFGRVPDITKVDFTMPDDHRITKELFKELKKKKSKPEVYIGCAKWGRKDWIGKLYPPKTKDAAKPSKTEKVEKTKQQKEEAEEAKKYVEECMRWRPKWAQTLPLNCEAGIGNSYGEC
mgnify:CR=1 FL=1